MARFALVALVVPLVTSFVVPLVGVGCGGTASEPGAGSATGTGSAPPATASPASTNPGQPEDARTAIVCTRLPFAEETPVPEASGAAWMTIDGALALVVISDSGNDGAYAIVDPESGATREQGKLPLGGDGEDLEGVATRGGKLHVITSPGWMRVYQRVPGGFELVDGPYPLGPIDIAAKGGGMGDRAPAGTGMVCGAKTTNCGRNYEGLCLAPDAIPGRAPSPTPSPTPSPPADSSAARCVGFAASKADGHLYCLTETGGRLAVHHPDAIRIARNGVVADCAFSADGTLYVGSNLFDFGTVYRVDGWQDPATATVEKIAPLAIGFPETLAVRGDVIYRMSDTGGAPSLMKKFRCR